MEILRSKKRKKKKKYKLIIPSIIILISIIGLIVSTYKIIIWKKDSDNTDKQVKEIQEIVTIVEKEDDETIEIIEQKEEIPAPNPYWDYIKMNLINVNFNELKTLNSDTKGWIQVNGTNINYPFVKTTDNKYYLTHSFDKSKNEAGWVFIDYRNNVENIHKNTIIYAHSRLDNTMFGSLKNILKNGWLSDTNNHVIKLSTESENTLWQVFSVYRIPTTSDYLQIEFSSNKQFLNFANMLLKRSKHNFNTTINENDYILTLSTCYNDDEKTVLHAKLIKREPR